MAETLGDCVMDPKILAVFEEAEKRLREALQISDESARNRAVFENGLYIAKQRNMAIADATRDIGMDFERGSTYIQKLLK